VYSPGPLLQVLWLLLGRLDEARPLVAALVAAGWRDPDFLSLCRERGLACPAA